MSSSVAVLLASMTSLLAFFNPNIQMPLGLLVTGAYIILILLIVPYIRCARARSRSLALAHV